MPTEEFWPVPGMAAPESLREFTDSLDIPGLTPGQFNSLFWLTRAGRVLRTKAWGPVNVAEFHRDDEDAVDEFVRTLAAGDAAFLGETPSHGMLEFRLLRSGAIVVQDFEANTPRAKADAIVGKLLSPLGKLFRVPLPTWNGGRPPFE